MPAPDSTAAAGGCTQEPRAAAGREPTANSRGPGGEVEAPTGIEPVIKVLQTSALPLGYGAYVLVPRVRFELTRPKGHCPLKTACLPVPPPGPRPQIVGGERFSVQGSAFRGAFATRRPPPAAPGSAASRPEPTTAGVSSSRAEQLRAGVVRTPPREHPEERLAGVAGFEPATLGFGGRCSTN